ncbi:MAG TPA: FecR domain-containing protein [Polyangiaceae bacterium]|nr:FecR domain-containing protein [Polyangiaceae bacterium]
MRKLKERPPADFVRMPATDERLLELWSSVERGEERQRVRKRRWRVAGAGAAVVALLVGAFSLTWSRDPAPVAGVAPAGEQAPSAEGAPTEPAVPTPTSEMAERLSLADGSHLELSDGARARVLVMRADEVRVRLERGQVECDVAPRRERRFVVEAGTFEVVVTGTQFTVSAAGDGAQPSSVAVSVQRGSVEVREAPDRLLAALGVGQRWASDRPAGAALDASDAGAAAAPSPARPSNLSSASSAPSSAPSASRADARTSPRTLLARASDARLAGKPLEAAAALRELIRQYPRDERAGYAAFLLGRIELDALDDARAAVASFSFAVTHPGSGFFMEDAEARRIEALARAGQLTECARERDRFLSKYPNAARAASLRMLCPAK